MFIYIWYLYMFINKSRYVFSIFYIFVCLLFHSAGFIMTSTYVLQYKTYIFKNHLYLHFLINAVIKLQAIQMSIMNCVELILKRKYLNIQCQEDQKSVVFNLSFSKTFQICICNNWKGFRCTILYFIDN